MPTWGGDLSEIDFDNIYYYLKPTEKQGKTWDDVPDDIKNTFDKLGIPEAERKFLAGVGGPVRVRGGLPLAAARSWRSKGVIFLDMDSAAARVPRPGAASTSARSSRRTTTSSPR